MEPSPFDSQHPDPFGHAVSAGGQRVAELVSVAVMVAQLAGRERARRHAGGSPAAEADLASSRTAWGPALDPVWRTEAGLFELARAWAAAVPLEQADDHAALAIDAAEMQLRKEHPHAMAQYDRRRAAGEERAEAMLAVIGDFARHPVNGANPAAAAAPGLTDTEADILTRLLGGIARLTARSAEAGRGPLDPRDVAGYLRGDLPPGMAARVSQGLAVASSAFPSPAATPPAAPQTVSDFGPAALSWPAGVREGVSATVLRNAAGGRRIKARRAATAQTNRRTPRRQA